MAAVKWKNKDPQDIAVYGLDGWRRHLDLAEGVTITGTPTWSVTPSGLTLGAAAWDATAEKASVRVSGGTSGTTYVVTCHVVTSDGQEFDRSAELFVGDR